MSGLSDQGRSFLLTAFIGYALTAAFALFFSGFFYFAPVIGPLLIWFSVEWCWRAFDGGSMPLLLGLVFLLLLLIRLSAALRRRSSGPEDGEEAIAPSTFGGIVGETISLVVVLTLHVFSQDAIRWL
ncbi:MAG: hypothetical protein AAGA23_06575 [Pseudomonadota bacterium]